MNYKLTILSSTVSAAIFSSVFSVAQAADLPTNGQVQSGQATISTSGNQMNIQQSTPKVSIDWESFDVGKDHSVAFQQPNADSVAFNRVKGGNASQIQGRLSANGKVFLANPDGVIFSKDAQINVGSLLATTKDLAEGQDINSKNLKFVRKTDKEGEINNQAHIVVDSKNGFVVLVGDKVKNEGTIEAKPFEKTDTKERWICDGGEDWMCEDDWTAEIYGVSWKKITETVKTQTLGQVVLATGDGFTLNLEDSYIDVKVDPNTMAGLVKNDGIIIADDGRIELTAKGQDQALAAVVNNNGVLQANHISMNKSGTISLTAGNVQLDTKSNIKSNNQLNIKSPTTELNVEAKKGAKITVKNTEIAADKLNLSGEFAREDSNEFFNSELQTQSNSFTVKTKGKLSLNNDEEDQNGNSHIQHSALASMLGNSGQVNLELDLPTTKDNQPHYELTGVNFSGKLNVDSYKNADSVLLITTPSYLKIQDADIRANNGRLSIGTALWNFRPENKPADLDASVTLNNSHLDLNNGSFGVARDLQSRYRVYFASNGKSAEEDQRSFYNFNLMNAQFDRVDDFFIGGGFGKVNIDGLHHNGRMNTYINAGNSRDDATPNLYEYGLRDLKERLTRSQRDHSRRRWNFYSKVGDLDLETLVNFEVSQVFDSWFVGQHQPNDPKNTKYIRHHLDTEINIKNSNIKSQNGFIHLMAKNVNITDSDFNINFDKVLSYTEGNLNKIGINAEKTVLDNSHLRIEGSDLKGVSPNAGFASFYLIGDLLGKNKSSVWVKSHQGYTMQTNGDVTLKGEKTPDDLKITVLNTGGYAEPDVGIGTDNPDDYLSSRGFVAGNTPRKKTILDNATMEVLAPNGSEAYKTQDDLPFEIKDNATFNYFEKPRIRGFDLAKISGKGGNKLTERQYLQAFDRAYGIKSTNLSSQQSQQIADHKLALLEPSQREIEVEKIVNLSLCDENGECSEEGIGDKHSNAKVSVGQIH